MFTRLLTKEFFGGLRTQQLAPVSSSHRREMRSRLFHGKFFHTHISNCFRVPSITVAFLEQKNLPTASQGKTKHIQMYLKYSQTLDHPYKKDIGALIHMFYSMVLGGTILYGNPLVTKRSALYRLLVPVNIGGRSQKGPVWIFSDTHGTGARQGSPAFEQGVSHQRN